jgi:RimJ/RimL family protein N-acetyltransferase
MTVEHRFPSRLSRLLTIHGATQAIRNRCWYHLDLCFYACSEKDILALPKHQLLRRDCFDDLQYYERCEPKQMLPEVYRRESMRRRELGYHLYTLVQDGRMVFHGWLVDRQARSEDPILGQVFFPPTDASVIFDCFTHPVERWKGVYSRSLCEMLHDAREIAQARQVCMAAFASNPVSCHVIEKLGFHYLGSMIKQRRLFMTQRYAVAAEHQFQTALL